MSIDKVICADRNGLEDLTPEEARRKREHFLTVTEENTRAGQGTYDEIDSADSTMATLVLPGG
jgi:hypothetical protein